MVLRGKNFMTLLNMLLRIWAYLPVFALTDDLGFLTSNPNGVQHKYYFSLISILFGEKKFQFMSFPIKQPNEKVVLLRVVQLSKMETFALSEAKENELKTNYKTHYESLRDKDKNIEKEALLRHLSDQQSRIDTSYNKINAFTTIIVAVIPIAITFIDRETIISLNTLGKVIFILLVYAIVNLCAWIFQATNVRGFMRSSFSDLKVSNNMSKEQNWQIYYDWQQARRNADMFVSFVKYTKGWIIAVIILTAIFSIGLPFSQKTASSINDNQAYTIQTDQIEVTYKKSAVNWYNILAELQTGEYKKIFVLYNEADLANIKEQLNRFEQQEIIWVSDDTLNKNEIKIILEK